MRMVLHGQSSLSQWLTAESCTPYNDRLGKRILDDCEPTLEAVRYLERVFPHLPQPYHVSVSARNKKRVPEAVAHESVYHYSSRIYCRIGSGVFASCPELCLAQLGNALSLFELLFASNVLCGGFRIYPETGALGQRHPLTDAGKILTFLQRNPGMPGSKSVREIVRWTVQNVASPPEAVLAMMLRLPFRLGGFRLEGFKANHRIAPSVKAQSIAGRKTLVPDILFEGPRLVLEYDSTAEHTSAQQLARDAKKRMALESDGYKVITVTAKQMQKGEEMRKVAVQIYRHLGLRFRPRNKAFECKQQELLGVGRMLDRFLVRGELAGAEGPRSEDGLAGRGGTLLGLESQRS